jgi:HK97 family phage prohead protease
MSTDFQTKSIPGQLNVDQAEGIVECFVAGIGNKDSVGDIVLPGAFEGSLKRRKPRVVWGHDWNHPIGRVLEIYEVGPNDRRLPEKMRAARIGGLFAKVQFNLKSERGREAFANISFFGAEQEWSIGYKTIQAVYDNTRQANLLKEVELYEVSPVLHGANQLTGTISIKSDDAKDRVTSFKKSKWPMFDRAYAERIKTEHPNIWDKGGNIKGDDQYTILTRIAEQGGTAKTEDQIQALELREAWIARHLKDFQLPGVVAQMKWLAIGSRGEGHMKDVVREAISKSSDGKAEAACPIATRDVAVNLENRQKAIESAGYGPLNPEEPNLDFWAGKARRWDVSTEDAQKQKCGNCAAFVKTERMMDCIKQGLANESGNEAEGVIEAGDLGYCEAFDFKCAAARTCDAWIGGGPVTSESEEQEKGYGYGKPHSGENREELLEMWRRLSGYAADREGSSDDDPREELDEIAESAGMSNPAMGRQAVLARSLANELRSPVRIRTMTSNTVVFDVMDPSDPDDVTTMRSSWHAEEGRVMIGKPERVRVETVYVPMEGGGGQAYSGDAEKGLGATIGGGRSREGQSEIDRDGDGVIFDGTPDEKPAPKKRPQQESRPAANRATSNSKASYHRARWKNGEKSFFHEDGSGIIQDSNGKEYSVGNWEEAPSKVYANVPKNLRSKAKQAREAALRKADTERWNRELGGAGYEDILARAQRKASLGRDANLPRSWKFNDSDGHTTTVEEDGSGVVRHRDGGVVFSYGGFDDPEALAETPAEMRKRLQKMRAYQWASNQVARASLEKSADSDMDVKADPRAGIPQEAITGDILRGYGPRRGNLERLLRYWRPIMKKPGGFRRCRVILADHPELYPLENICAWLHHETTGLWPNEGCHHPGMKNCKRKLRGVRDGSIWSDAEFGKRIRRRSGNKKDLDLDDYEDMGEITDEDVKYANRVLNEFLAEEKEFAAYLADEKNWEEIDDDDDSYEGSGWVKPDNWDRKPGGCGCGCAGKGGAGSCSPYKSVEDSLDELREKVGRSLNSRNAERIAEAIRLLTEVIGGGPEPSMERKQDGGLSIAVPIDSLYEMRETIDPIVDYYGLDVEVDEDGVHVKGELAQSVVDALSNAVNVFEEIQTKGFEEV